MGRIRSIACGLVSLLLVVSIGIGIVRATIDGDIIPIISWSVAAIAVTLDKTILHRIERYIFIRDRMLETLFNGFKTDA